MGMAVEMGDSLESLSGGVWCLFVGWLVGWCWLVLVGWWLVGWLVARLVGVASWNLAELGGGVSWDQRSGWERWTQVASSWWGSQREEREKERAIPCFPTHDFDSTPHASNMAWHSSAEGNAGASTQCVCTELELESEEEEDAWEDAWVETSDPCLGFATASLQA